jgi:hypothetical protein
MRECATYWAIASWRVIRTVQVGTRTISKFFQSFESSQDFRHGSHRRCTR